jgi:hypothetical protein
MVEDNGFIHNHRFSFRRRHSIIEETHWILQNINEMLENEQYSSVVFLDISQVFDKVWHTERLYKLRLFLPLNYFILFKSYFLMEVQTEYTELSPDNAEVHQGNVLGPQLYLLYPEGLPISTESTPAAFTNDWSRHCFTETANQPRHNPKMVKGMENTS